MEYYDQQGVATIKIFGVSIHWPQLVFVFIVAVLLLTFLGPFDTFLRMPMLQRLLFWGCLLVLCGLFFHTIVMYVIHNPRLSSLPRIVRLLIGTFIASFPGLAAFLLVSYVVRDRVYYPSFYPFLWITVFVIGTAVSCANFLPPFANLQFERDSRRGVKPSEIPFLARISRNLGTQLISVSIQDHYVEVVTKLGREMIYLSFSEAMDELEKYPGLQIHRSHWIAEETFVDIVREGRSTFARTSDGRKLPVSVPFRKPAELVLEQRN